MQEEGSSGVRQLSNLGSRDADCPDALQEAECVLDVDRRHRLGLAGECGRDARGEPVERNARQKLVEGSLNLPHERRAQNDLAPTGTVNVAGPPLDAGSSLAVLSSQVCTVSTHRGLLSIDGRNAYRAAVKRLAR